MKNKPIFEIIKETNRKDGGVTWEYEVNDDFKKMAKEHYGKKRFTRELGNRLILEAVHNAIVKDSRKALEEKLEKDKLKSFKLNNIKVK